MKVNLTNATKIIRERLPYVMRDLTAELKNKIKLNDVVKALRQEVEKFVNSNNNALEKYFAKINHINLTRLVCSIKDPWNYVTKVIANLTNMTQFEIQ